MTLPTVRAALTEGRLAVARALEMGASTGPEPDEDTLTWLLCSTVAWTSSRVTVRRFNSWEESRLSGADWVWWWQGDDKRWFGCLVQAKRLMRTAAGETFDYAFRPVASASNPTPPRQIERLLTASDILKVPAAYMLYRSPVLGPPGGWSCPTLSPDWKTGASTFVPAAVVHEWLYHDEAADLSHVRPVDCLACDGLCGDDLAILAWYARNLADSEVRRLLMAPPNSAAAKAFRSLFSAAAQLRFTQFRATSGQDDAYHSGFRFADHLARGYRVAPWYVSSVLDGEEVDASDVGAGVGVVIVRNE